MKRRILIVEDETDLSEVIAYDLKSNGYEVACSTTCAGARQFLEQSAADCVVLDLMLPDGSGISLLKWIRTHHGYAHLPVVIASARVAELDRSEAFKMGADAYLTKPVRLSDLRTRVGALVQQAQSA